MIGGGRRWDRGGELGRNTGDLDDGALDDELEGVGVSRGELLSSGRRRSQEHRRRAGISPSALLDGPVTEARVARSKVWHFVAATLILARDSALIRL